MSAVRAGTALVLIQLTPPHGLPSSSWIKITRAPTSLPVRILIGSPRPAKHRHGERRPQPIRPRSMSLRVARRTSCTPNLRRVLRFCRPIIHSQSRRATTNWYSSVGFEVHVACWLSSRQRTRQRCQPVRVLRSFGSWQACCRLMRRGCSPMRVGFPSGAHGTASAARAARAFYANAPGTCCAVRMRAAPKKRFRGLILQS